MDASWMLALAIVTTSIGTGLIALLLIGLGLGRFAVRPRAAAVQPALEETVFLFDDQDLVDATTPARMLLDAVPMGGSDWARLCAFAGPRFAGFAEAMGTLADRGRLELVSAPGLAQGAPLRLIAEDAGGLARITLHDPSAEGQGILVDALSHRALEEEVDLLRAATDRAPVLSWRENAQGEVIWANRAYILRSNALDNPDEVLSWPLPRLFDLGAPLPSAAPRRLRITAADDRALWFDCHAYPLEDGAICFALPADATVRAERALRDFVQTLTKTFADLPIGLAIFDRQRQLQLFNPALIDLTQLGAEFLSGRPTLYAFLDRLREARMMPEPKDYRSWRLQMTELEQASAAGFHSETWSLPSGQTYRVTGRPHPDGAVAFLFEDISSEISLTRRFRAAAELSHEVFDSLEEAVAVFQPSGELLMSNTAFTRLWQFDPAETLGCVTLNDTIRVWQSFSLPNPIWTALQGYASRMGDRRPLSAGIALRDGRQLSCRFLPLTGGGLMASFHILPTAIGPSDAPLLLTEAL